MRVLGVDFGSKRIGIAVGESEPAITAARPPLAACGSLKGDAVAICDLAKKEEAVAVILGVPRNQPDKSDRMERICLKLAERIREEGWTVHLVNEALTSSESEKNLASVYKRSAKQKKLDGEAARLILERFFDGQT